MMRATISIPPTRRSLLLVAMTLSVAAAGAAAVADALVRTPPQYDTFVPPAAGGSYVDPVFGTIIKRLSDARNTVNAAYMGTLAFVSTEYSTMSPFNSNDTRLILVHQSYFGLYEGDGRYLRDLPLEVHASAEPRWSRRDPNALYYVRVNDLMKLDVATGATSLVHSFGEYAAISGRGQSEISRDGDHFVFAGDNRYVFVYQISADRKGPVLDTAGHPFANLTIAPDNSVAIGWLANGTGRFSGIELFDRRMVFRRQLAHALGHMHLARDRNGDEVLLWNNSGDPAPLASCQNGIVKLRLADARQTCLLELDWSLAVHITAPDRGGWAFVETYAPGDPQPEAPAWKPYTNEILQLKLDGSETRRLLHHRSRPFDSYVYQPKASVSRDGSRFVFTSNYGLQASQGFPNEYADVYFVAVPPVPSSCPASVDREREGDRSERWECDRERRPEAEERHERERAGVTEAAVTPARH